MNSKRRIVAGIASLVLGMPLFFFSFGDYWNYKYAMNKVRDRIYSNVANSYESVREAEDKVRKTEEKFFYDKLQSGIGMGSGAGLLGIGYVCLSRREK